MSRIELAPKEEYPKFGLSEQARMQLMAMLGFTAFLYCSGLLKQYENITLQRPMFKTDPEIVNSIPPDAKPV